MNDLKLLNNPLFAEWVHYSIITISFNADLFLFGRSTRNSSLNLKRVAGLSRGLVEACFT